MDVATTTEMTEYHLAAITSFFLLGLDSLHSNSIRHGVRTLEKSQT